MYRGIPGSGRIGAALKLAARIATSLPTVAPARRLATTLSQMKLKCALVVLCSISTAIAEIPPAPRFSVEHRDRSVEPGKDFYRSANGNCEKKNSIPPDQVTWSPTTQLIERNWAILKEIVESAAQPRAERSPE